MDVGIIHGAYDRGFRDIEYTAPQKLSSSMTGPNPPLDKTPPSVHRQLQQQDLVQITFVVGLQDANRAQNQVGRKLKMLADGLPEIIESFVKKLDSELERRGKTPLGLAASDLSFSYPQQIKTPSQNRGQNYHNTGAQQLAENQSPETGGGEQKNSISLALVLLFIFGIGALAVLMYRGGRKRESPALQEMDYTTKVAAWGNTASTEWEADTPRDWGAVENR